MISLIYVSAAQIEASERNRVLDDILTASIARNSTLDITGILLVAPQHFAQLLEGPIRAVEAVMASIQADLRHTNVRLLRKSPILKPSCANWRMVLFDSGAFGQLCVAPLLQAAHGGNDADAVHRLELLIEAAATGPTFAGMRWHAQLQRWERNI